MGDGLNICHIVNSIGDTSMSGDLATAQTEHEAIDEVGILAWFDIEPFRNDDKVDLYCLDIPSGRFHINRSEYMETKSVLSAYDIVHTHHPHSGFFGKLISRRLGKPVVHTDHNNHDGFSRKGRIANGLTNVFADRIVPVSESVRESYAWWEELLINNKKVEVVNNGVDIERVEAARSIDWSIHDLVDIDPDAAIVGSAGMLVEQKAHDVLIKAVDLANRESERPIELVISGSGELRDELEAQIASAEFSDRLHLLGFLEKREQVYKMMHEIDIYAMPSRWEGFCVAALEAMAIGNACVFSDIEEFHEPFHHLAKFHPVDSPNRLSNKIVMIAEDENIRKALSKKSHGEIRVNHTIKKTVDGYVLQYSKLLATGCINN